MCARPWAVGLLAPLFLFVAACGGSGPKTVRVKGTVTLDDKPLAGATVVYSPDGGSGRMASGQTDANGNFELTTFQTGDGAVPGSYKVLVTLNEQPDNMTVNPMEMDAKEKMAFFMGNSPEGRAKEAKKKRKSLIPTLYSDAAKTPLKEVVPPTGSVTLPLKSSAR